MPPIGSNAKQSYVRIAVVSIYAALVFSFASLMSIDIARSETREIQNYVEDFLKNSRDKLLFDISSADAELQAARFIEHNFLAEASIGAAVNPNPPWQHPDPKRKSVVQETADKFRRDLEFTLKVSGSEIGVKDVSASIHLMTTADFVKRLCLWTKLASISKRREIIRQQIAITDNILTLLDSASKSLKNERDLLEMGVPPPFSTMLSSSSEHLTADDFAYLRQFAELDLKRLKELGSDLTPVSEGNDRAQAQADCRIHTFILDSFELDGDEFFTLIQVAEYGKRPIIVNLWNNFLDTIPLYINFVGKEFHKPDGINFVLDIIDDSVDSIEYGEDLIEEAAATRQPVEAKKEPLHDILATSLEGLYDAQGTNPGGSRYSGTCRITRIEGNKFQFDWSVGGIFEGTGSLEGRTITVDWGSADPVIYEVQNDGTLVGTWANGSATETLFPKKKG
nr:hypothetical protein RAR13_10015 [Aminobacter aminovorans]